MNTTNIKDIINDGLKKNRMTQAALANLMGIERATVNRWCVGRAIPEADTFLKVCQILRIKIDPYLSTESDDISMRITALTNNLNEAQKISLLKCIVQIMEIVKESSKG